MKMKTIAVFRLLFFVLSVPVILDLADYAVTLLGFYHEDAVNAAGGYPESGTIDWWRPFEGSGVYFLPYFFMTLIIVIFPLSLISTLPRAISHIANYRCDGLPSWTALIRLFLCGFGFLFSLLLAVVSAEGGELPSPALSGFALSNGTAAVILGAKIYSDPRLKTCRELGAESKAPPAIT